MTAADFLVADTDKMACNFNLVRKLCHANHFAVEIFLTMSLMLPHDRELGIASDYVPYLPQCRHGCNHRTPNVASRREETPPYKKGKQSTCRRGRNNLESRHTLNPHGTHLVPTFVGHEAKIGQLPTSKQAGGGSSAIGGVHNGVILNRSHCDAIRGLLLCSLNMLEPDV